MIGLIDYGSGNLRSVSKALEQVGAQVRLVNSPEGFDGLKAVVLPGVGAFGDCVRNLHENRLWQPVADWLAADRPFLGICLGYQMLFESSDESPGVAGFGRFAGKVVRFANNMDLKVPQMGWNTLKFPQPDCVLWQGLEPEPFVYFVHSYYPQPADEKIVAATCEYGVTFAAGVATGNTMAVQFHPEKSQAVGLRMLENFVRKYA